MMITNWHEITHFSLLVFFPRPLDNSCPLHTRFHLFLPFFTVIRVSNNSSCDHFQSSSPESGSDPSASIRPKSPIHPSNDCNYINQMFWLTFCTLIDWILRTTTEYFIPSTERCSSSSSSQTLIPDTTFLFSLYVYDSFLVTRDV